MKRKVVMSGMDNTQRDGMLGILIQRCSKVSVWLAWIGGAMLLACAVLVSLDVIVRSIWKVTLFESFELSTYAFAISVSMGMSYALVSKAHIRIEVVYMLLPAKLRGWLDTFSYAGLALVCVAFAYWCGSTVLDNFETGARSNSTLAVPLVLPQTIWLIGLIWFALLSVVFACYGIWKCVSGNAEQAHQKLGMASLEDEINTSTVQEKK
jgi:TRAP-type C4-dicarboxylate transport system permease small subunit